jgi:hypothetical protein
MQEAKSEKDLDDLQSQIKSLTQTYQRSLEQMNNE